LWNVLELYSGLWSEIDKGNLLIWNWQFWVWIWFCVIKLRLDLRRIKFKKFRLWITYEINWKMK
jgi:hypothetical protein